MKVTFFKHYGFAFGQRCSRVKYTRHPVLKELRKVVLRIVFFTCSYILSCSYILKENLQLEDQLNDSQSNLSYLKTNLQHMEEQTTAEKKETLKYVSL